MLDEEKRQRRALEMAFGTSCFVPESGDRSITDGAEVDVGTTESAPVEDLAGSGKLNPSIYR